MGLLDEPGLDRLVKTGCAACGGRKLTFRTYVDGAFPFLAGEPVGRPSWAYDGEKFVDGVYAVACAGCGATLFAADVCPRCHAPGGLGTALGSENRWPVPAGCADADCGGEEVRYLAFVPVSVTYEGERADRPRGSVEPHDPGFHGYRADCRACRQVVAARNDAEACPLCDGPGPLRARPG
jgi:RNA polymerase subunit RPABC4/transcription elongation factor Spt4